MSFSDARRGLPPGASLRTAVIGAALVACAGALLAGSATLYVYRRSPTGSPAHDFGAALGGPLLFFPLLALAPALVSFWLAWRPLQHRPRWPTAAPVIGMLTVIVLASYAISRPGPGWSG
jgi:hypothetical protein